MAELADASDLGSDASGVQVRPLLSAPIKGQVKKDIVPYFNKQQHYVSDNIIPKTQCFF